MAIENAGDVRRLLRATLADPTAAEQRLPALVGALSHDERAVRTAAAWAVCAVAAADPSVWDPLSARLRATDSSAARLALEWIDEAVERADAGRSGAVSSSSEPAEHPDERPPGPDAPDARGSSDAAESGETTPDEGSDLPQPDASPPDEESPDAEADDGDDGGEDAGAGPRDSPYGSDEVVVNDRFTIPLDRTAFDGLSIVDEAQTDRHAWTYTGMATVDARRHAVLVRSYREPRGASRSRFAAAFEDVLEAWAGVDDHDGVLTLYDYGRRPHPWVVTEYAPTTLRSVGRLPVESAFRVGLDAATGLAHAHDRGVLHRSLDPRSIALESTDGRAVGRLWHFGIVEPFRAVDGPLPLDSRYAAPELFDDEHGGIDARTDVYHLGAVLYTAFTGRPPYDQSLVRRGGPEGLSYPPPSRVIESVPVAADRIVAKAMATHKIGRYESADELVRDLQAAVAEVGDGA